MKKLLFAFALTASFGISQAQSVDVFVNLTDVASISIAGIATIDVNTMDEWTGAVQTIGNTITGTTTTTSGLSSINITSGLGWGFPQLDDAVVASFNGRNFWHGEPTPQPLAEGVNAFSGYFYTRGGVSLLGVPAGSYVATYDFIISTI
jgi:hypothetical protein